MTVMATAKSRALEVLKVEEREAWLEYLEATQPLGAPRYAEVESWAWARLRRQLMIVEARRRKLAVPGA